MTCTVRSADVSNSCYPFFAYVCLLACLFVSFVNSSCSSVTIEQMHGERVLVISVTLAVHKFVFQFFSFSICLLAPSDKTSHERVTWVHMAYPSPHPVRLQWAANFWPASISYCTCRHVQLAFLRLPPTSCCESATKPYLFHTNWVHWDWNSSAFSSITILVKDVCKGQF